LSCGHRRPVDFNGAGRRFSRTTRDCSERSRSFSRLPSDNRNGASWKPHYFCSETLRHVLNLLSNTQPQVNFVGHSSKSSANPCMEASDLRFRRLFHHSRKERPEDAGRILVGSIYYDMGHIGAARTDSDARLNWISRMPASSLLSVIESSPRTILWHSPLSRSAAVSSDAPKSEFVEELGDLLLRFKTSRSQGSCQTIRRQPREPRLLGSVNGIWRKETRQNCGQCLQLDPTHIRAGC